MRLLIVEDEPTLGDLLRRNLTARGFAVDLAQSRGDAAAFLDIETYDGSAGLGLAIVAEAAKRLKAQLSLARTDEAGGATFSLIFPR